MLASRIQVDEAPLINMTPMVDVILCLLVFFMAATRLYDWDESEFLVSVPEVAEAQPASAAPDDLILVISSRGSVSIDQSTYDLDKLVVRLSEARNHYANQGVVIRGDASLAYQDLADVLSACDEAGIRNVACPFGPVTMRRGVVEFACDPTRTALPCDPQRASVLLILSDRSMYGLILADLSVACQCVLGGSSSEPGDDQPVRREPRVVALRRLVRDHFCRDGACGDAPSAGDSLLFAVGAVAAHPGSPLNIGVLAVLLVVAAVLGDAVNYSIGYFVGPRVFSRDKSWLLNKKHLERAQKFYDDYGGATIVLARFIPIVRTFAPFVAGIGKMSYRRFAVYNVAGGAAWILIFLLGGWLFGNLKFVQDNFKLLAAAIVVISVLPGVVEFIRAWCSARNRKAERVALAVPQALTRIDWWRHFGTELNRAASDQNARSEVNRTASRKPFRDRRA